LDEFYQSLIPTREASIVDVFLDVLGIFLVMILFPRLPPFFQTGSPRNSRKLGSTKPLIGTTRLNLKGGDYEKSSYIFVLLSLVFLWPVFAWAQVGENYTVELEGRMWNVKLDSTVKVVQNGIGTDMKLVDDLGFDERNNFFEGRLQVKFARAHKFNLEYIP